MMKLLASRSIFSYCSVDDQLS